jgi:predicted N-acyltransferase
MERRGVQFHWRNTGDWKDFDEFLQSLAQPKRKKIRAERRKVREAGIHCTRRDGTQLDATDWSFFYRCYASTYAAHGSTPYLSEAFFQDVGARMPEAFVMVQAWRDAAPVAASLLVRDHDRLYGRYWGCLERVDSLHFECAYYQAIEAALERDLAVVEGGAQGEHKMARGFLPEETRSLHWLAEPAFADAVRDFLSREGQMMSGYLDELDERTPFRAQDQKSGLS